MKNVSISIIIPAFNAAKNLPLALTSITMQNFRNFEVWVIDGGSTDDTVSYLESQKNVFSNIKFISEKDTGIYDAMNKGILLSTGDWIYFMGSDDTLYDENVLGNIYDVIKTDPAKVIYGNVVINGDCGWAKDKDIYDGKFTIKKLFKKNICHQAIFYNRSVFEEIGNYNIAYRICADYDLNLKIASRYKLKYVDLKIANFNGGGASTKGDMNKPADEHFYADRNANVFEYYKSKALAGYMSKVFPLMIEYGRQKFRNGHYALGIYFIVIGNWHRAKIKLHSCFQNTK